MNFEQAPEFQKELKRLTKKWRSLPQDVNAAQRDLVPLYMPQSNIDIMKLREAFFNGKKAAILYTSETHEVVKMRLDVESIGRNDKVRVIFVAIKTSDTLQFVELYAKNEKDRENQERIKKYL